MNTMNKILLAIVIATTNHQVFTSEMGATGTVNQNNAKVTTENTSVVVQKTPADILKEQKLITETAALKYQEAEAAVEKYEKTLAANTTLNESERTAALKNLKSAAATSKIIKEQEEANYNAAWAKADPYYQATFLKYATGIGLGGFLITKLELTGKTATCVKGVSLVSAIAVTAFLLDKGYNYFFKEEVENEDLF
jgi:hypothetical protein